MPEVCSTDQGSQSTSLDLTKRVKQSGSQMSLDGQGRWADNIFVERLWRTVKYEEIYLKYCLTVEAARTGLGAFFAIYNLERNYQAWGYRTPA